MTKGEQIARALGAELKNRRRGIEYRPPESLLTEKELKDFYQEGDYYPSTLDDDTTDPVDEVVERVVDGDGENETGRDEQLTHGRIPPAAAFYYLALISASVFAGGLLALADMALIVMLIGVGTGIAALLLMFLERRPRRAPGRRNVKTAEEELPGMSMGYPDERSE